MQHAFFLLRAAFYVIRNGTKFDNTQPVLVYQDEIASVASGLSCHTSTNASGFWFYPNGNPVVPSHPAIPPDELKLAFVQYMNRYDGRSVLRYADIVDRTAPDQGLFACGQEAKTADIEAVPVGIYARRRSKEQ